MMKNRQNAAALILLLLLFSGSLLLGFLSLHRMEQGTNDRGKVEGLRLLCPKLNECGDALILYDGKEAVMIDTGVKKDAALLLTALRDRGITHLDALILTHFDKDHIGGAAAILKELEVKSCYMTAGKEESMEYAALFEALSGIKTQAVTVTKEEHLKAFGSDLVIYPPLTDTFEKDKDNNMSLITSLTGPGCSLLFMGDAQKERIDEYLEKQYDGTSYQFLKVPHHGRDEKPLKKLLGYFIPETAVICSSDEEPEDAACVALLEEAGSRVLLTRKGDQEIDPGKLAGGQSRQDEQAERERAKAGDSGKTAGGDKEQTDKDVIVEAPVLSRPAGFYEKGFDLTISSAPGTKVYYSLDCSEPGPKSRAYKEPVRITDPAGEPAVHSKRTDFWPYLPLELPRHKSLGGGWYVRFLLPDQVDQCRIIRAVAVDGDGNQSRTVTASYFIGYKDKKGYDKLPVLSLTSDPDDLFSEEKGIMVNGSKYQEKLKSGALDGITNSHQVRSYCNSYRGRGRKWERRVHIDYFGAGKKNLVFSQEAGIRLHGNQSRVAEAQKSFNLYARESYDGNKVFRTPFFEDGLLADKITLMRGMDLRNYYLSEKMDGRSMHGQKYRLAQVFLDGEYWGLYAIQERYNSDAYLETHYNLEKEDYTLAKGTPTGFDIKNGDPDAIRTSFKKVRDFAAGKDLSENANYRTLCGMMDMDSFIDCYAAKIYTGDQDWSWFKNQYLIYYDNKWHWMTYDIDYGAGAHETSMEDVDTFSSTRVISDYSLANDPLFPHLMKNKDFCRDFVNAFLDLSNETFRGKKIKKEMDTFAENYKSECRLLSKRYPNLAPDGSKLIENELGENAGQVGRYFAKRQAFALRYLASYFHLKGKPVSVTIYNKNPEGGNVGLNTIEPTLNAKGKWKGTYYTDYPVSLSASPAPGYVFEGWKCKGGVLADKKAAITTLKLNKNAEVTAVFTKKEEMK